MVAPLPGCDTPWFEQYFGLEQAASIIRCYEVQFSAEVLQRIIWARTADEQIQGVLGTLRRSSKRATSTAA